MTWNIQQRYVLAFMLFLAIVMAVSLRSFIGIVLTQMVKVPNLNVTNTNATTVTVSSISIAHEEVCPSDEIISMDISVQNSGLRYDWSQKLQGAILSSYYWGSIVTQIPSGILATHYGGKYVLGLGLLFSAILTVLTPMAIQMGESTALIIIRVLMGFSQGAFFAAITTLFSVWVPLKERGRLVSLLFCGISISMIFATNSAAILIHSFKNWAIVYYVFGTVVIVWCVFFFCLCYNDPESHPFISDEEKQYIRKEMEENDRSAERQKVIPWKAILTSTPIIAFSLALVFQDISYYTISTDLPKYINDVLHIPVLKNGLYSTIPSIAGILVATISGWLCDRIIAKKQFSVNFTRKLFVALGAILPGLFLLSASYAGCDKMLVIVCLVLTVGSMGFNAVGLVLNAMDLSPNYAGALTALTQTIGSVAGLLAPYIVGLLTPNALLREWRLVFWIIAVVLVIQVVIFTVWGSAEVQSWNTPKKKSNDNENA